MSREERLFEAIGGVDESLLKRSEKRRRKVSRVEWAVGLAACLAVVLTVYALLPEPATNPPDPAEPLPTQQDDPDIQTDPPVHEDPSAGTSTKPYEPWPAEEGEWHCLQVRTDAEPEGPQFRIYINKELYYSYEQEGVYIIRPRQESDIVPECKLEISHMAAVTVDEALERVQESLTGLYEQIEPLPGPPNGWYSVEDTERFLFASDGTEWDDAQREVWIKPDGADGVFVLSSSYFMEAAEGHGARFVDMMGTFIPDSQLWDMVRLAQLRDAGERLMEAVFSHDLSGAEDLLAPEAEVNGYAEDVSGLVSVASIDYILPSLEDRTDTAAVSIVHRLGGEEPYRCLTIELEYLDGGWKAARIGFEE